jgi:integrase/recombinase XerD
MPKRFGLTLDAWPPVDRGAWERATASDDFFADEATAAHWRPASRHQAFYAYARWLTFVRDCRPDDLALTPAARASPTRLNMYLQALANRRLSPMGIAAELQHLLLALRALAPREDWRWLGKLQYAWQKRAQPRDVRQKMVDPRRILDLGLRLMATADECVAPTGRARQFRDGLLIALLIAVPIRRRSLAVLELERNVRIFGPHYIVVLNCEDTKAGHAVEFDLPTCLTPYVSRYVERYRSMFPRAQDQSALWLSSKGGKLGAEAIHALICRQTLAAFGVSIPPHLFRTIAATTIAREAPEKIAVARDLLAHANLTTTVHHYTQAQSVQAARKHGALIEKLRTHTSTAAPRQSTREQTGDSRDVER